MTQRLDPRSDRPLALQLADVLRAEIQEGQRRPGSQLPTESEFQRAYLGLPADDPARYTWERVNPGDRDHMPPGQRLLHVLTDRARWQGALTEARRIAQEGWPGRGAMAGGRTTHGCAVSVTCSNGCSATPVSGRCAVPRPRGRRHTTCTGISATLTRSCGRDRAALSARVGRRRSPARRWTPRCSGWMAELRCRRSASTRSAPTNAPARISPGWQLTASLPGPAELPIAKAFDLWEHRNGIR